MGHSVFLSVLMEIAGILNESRKLFLKNKKPMFFVVIFPLFLSSMVYLLHFFSIKSVVTNLILEASLLPGTDPNSLEYAGLLMSIFRDIRLFVGSGYIFSFVSSIISLFFTIAVVRASALTCREKNIQIKDLMFLSVKSWKQPLVTYFYITLFTLGYLFFFVITLLPVLLFARSPSSLGPRALTLWILFAAFEAYLAIVWHLSIVISILEETYGIQALGKAARIAKGMKIHLYLVNLLFGILYVVFGQGVRLIDMKKPFAVNVAIGLVVVNLICLVKMFQLVAFTVFYFHCKSIHGEEVELQGGVEYTKLPSTLLVGDNLP